jgi:ATP-dependent Clp protease ATP-binding subunit ClpA
MIVLPKSLVSELRSRHVDIDVLDTDTLMLRRVPTQVDVFNKPVTNLLLKRAAPGMPYLALVDESLTYLGRDPEVQTAFPPSAARQGWRALSLDVAADRDAGKVLQNALKILGFDSPPTPPAVPTQPRLIERFGRSLRDRASISTTVGRDREITEIIASLRRREPSMTLIVGGSGSGKTNLLHGVARRLSRQPGGADAIEIDLLDLLSVTVGAGRTRCLLELLAELAESHAIAAIEHAELLVGQFDLGHSLLSRALDQGVKLIGTALPEFVDGFNTPELARRLQMVPLPELPREHVIQIVLGAGPRYRVEINEAAAVACFKAARELPGQFPGKAVDLLDAAASAAEVNGATVLAPDDIYSVAKKHWPPAARCD